MKKRIKCDEIRAEALKYDTKTKFCKGAPGAYAAAKRLNIFDDVTSHMRVINKSYTDAELIRAASQYKSREEFKRGNSKAYHMCNYRKIQGKAFSHMSGRRRWTDEDLRIEALKYKSKAEFSLGSQSAYTTAHNRGIFNRICSHMKNEREYRTDDDLISLLSGHKTIKDFRQAHPSAYDLILRRGLGQVMRESLRYAKKGMDYRSPAIFYYAEIDGGKGYKIGVTTRTVRKRYSSRDFDRMRVIEEINFETAGEAYKYEKSLKKKYSSFIYEGSPLLADGNTEVFNTDILSMERQ